MAKIKCPRCGAETDDSNEFCPKCGKRLKKRKLCARYIIIPMVVVGAVIVVFLATSNIRKYDRAVSLMKDKKYEEAASEFETLKDYKNSEELSKEANYTYAKQELKNGNYNIALKKLAELGTYKDSEDLYQSGKYQYAEYLMKVEKYDKAADLFQSLKSYKDSSNQYAEALYNSAKMKEEDKDYAGALDLFERVSSYQDSEEHIKKDQHLADVQNDKTPPVISGIKNGDEIDTDLMSGFNMLDYLKDKIHVTDNVSENISYSVSTNADGYNSESGLVDTQKSGPKPFTISAKDEAGNTTKVKVIVKISDVIGISADNPNPVIYQDANHLVKFYTITTGDDMYHFKFQTTNNSDKNILVDVTQANADEDDTYIQLLSYGYYENMALKHQTTVVDAGGFAPADLKSVGLQNFNKMRLQIRIMDTDNKVIGTVNISVPHSMFPS